MAIVAVERKQKGGLRRLLAKNDGVDGSTLVFFFSGEVSAK